jgi:hypothetical protein
MAILYDPIHPVVLKIASLLISVLINLGEFFDAERYARFLYDCLTRPIDPESEEVADAADTLATVIYNMINKNGTVHDILEAETLSRKSIRIMERIQGIF